MYQKNYELRKYTPQERQRALDWLRGKVADRIPYAKGPIRLSLETVNSLVLPDYDKELENQKLPRSKDYDPDYRKEHWDKVTALHHFLLMVYYNWVYDYDDFNNQYYHVLGGQDNWLIPFMVSPEFDEYDDEYSFLDVIIILFCGQEDDCSYGLKLKTGCANGIGVDIFNYFEFELSQFIWRFTMTPELKETVNNGLKYFTK